MIKIFQYNSKNVLLLQMEIFDTHNYKAWSKVFLFPSHGKTSIVGDNED